MRLKDKYEKTIVPHLMKEFGYTNRLAAPRLVKAVVNVGFGRIAREKSVQDKIEDSLRRITGQKPIMIPAKKSISSFKVREGMVIGAKVTLRGQRLYEFLERLIHATFSRVRDFRGLDEKNVDSDGNLNLGFKEQVAFPEIGNDEVDNIHGLEISIVTTTGDRKASLELFRQLGFPFKKS